MQTDTPEDRCSSGVDVEEQARLFADLDNGLHAMSQPLTVLRGALGAMTLRPVDAADHGRYLAMSGKHVERLCDLLSCLKHLVNVYRFQLNGSDLDVWELLAPIIEDAGSPLRIANVEITVEKPDRVVLVFGDAERTEQAFRGAMRIAALLSSPGDTIELSVCQHDGFVELKVVNPNKHGKSLDSPDRLVLSLAQANILSQKGRFECVQDPLSISMVLPGQDSSLSKSIPDSDYV